MIVKTIFNPFKVLTYVWQELVCTFCFSTFAYWIYHEGDVVEFALPFAPFGVLGSCVAILLGFHANACYQRWWEARTLWGNLAGWSRVFARIVCTFVDAKKRLPNYDAARALAFKNKMIHRQIAFLNALRLQLRSQDDWHQLEPYLPADEYAGLAAHHNKASHLLILHGTQIYEGMSDGTLGGFDSFQMEGALAQFAALQSSCERIKDTPLPRAYDFFTRVFVWVFISLLPFFLLSLWPKNSQGKADRGYMIFPISLIFTFMYAVIKEVGTVNQTPFANRINDVPLSFICTEIERDVLDLLGGSALPPSKLPEDGYLW